MNKEATVLTVTSVKQPTRLLTEAMLYKTRYYPDQNMLKIMSITSHYLMPASSCLYFYYINVLDRLFLMPASPCLYFYYIKFIDRLFLMPASPFLYFYYIKFIDILFFLMPASPCLYFYYIKFIDRLFLMPASPCLYFYYIKIYRQTFSDACKPVFVLLLH